MNDNEERLIDTLLREELGGESPPNLTDRVLRAAGPTAWHGRPAPVRLAVAAAAFAAAVLCGVAVANWLAQGRPDPIPRGTLISTGDGPWRIRLGQRGYCRVEVKPRSTLRVAGEELAEEVFLERGELNCDVDRGVGSFAVRTEAGVVAVQGTKFSVRMVEARDEAAEGGTAMANRRMVVRVLLGAVLLSGGWGSTELQAGEDGGTVTGVVASKGETWIGVRAEGQEESTLYLPNWKGGLPKDGGGFDKEVLGAIKGLVVGSKVELAWKTTEEHPRIISVKVLALPEKTPEVAAAPEKANGEGEKVAATGEKPRKHGDGERPVAEGERPRKPVAEGERPKKAGEGERVAEGEKPKRHAEGDAPKADGPKQGVARGVVTSKGESWIEVKTDKDAPPEAYFPRWVGGGPKEGGGLDKEMLKLFSKVKVNDWVTIEWTRDERRRAVTMKIHSQQ